jgi:diaminopimelate decarboxylase
VLPFVSELKRSHDIGYFSIGGGMGIVYQDALASGRAEWWERRDQAQRPITPESYGAALTPLLEPLGLKILLEHGRFMVGNAGILLTRVEYLKRASGMKGITKLSRSIAILHAGPWSRMSWDRFAKAVIVLRMIISCRRSAKVRRWL